MVQQRLGDIDLVILQEGACRLHGKQRRRQIDVNGMRSLGTILRRIHRRGGDGIGGTLSEGLHDCLWHNKLPAAVAAYGRAVRRASKGRADHRTRRQISRRAADDQVTTLLLNIDDVILCHDIYGQRRLRSRGGSKGHVLRPGRHVTGQIAHLYADGLRAISYRRQRCGRHIQRPATIAIDLSGIGLAAQRHRNGLPGLNARGGPANGQRALRFQRINKVIRRYGVHRN